MIKKITLLASLVVLFSLSCKKAKVDNDTQSSVDNTICEGEFMRVTSEVNSLTIDEPGIKKTLGNACPAKTVSDTTVFPVTITLDYGTGCTDSIDGKTRKGRITLVYSGRWSKVGTSITTTFTNYYVSTTDLTMQIEGTITMVKGQNSITTSVTGGKCTSSNWTLEYASNRTVTHVVGTTTPWNPFDDVYSITGSSSGVDRNGKSYSVTIVEPLIKKTFCKYIVQGVLNLDPEGLATRRIDYGDGTCNDKATVSINGNVTVFSLQ